MGSNPRTCVCFGRPSGAYNLISFGIVSVQVLSETHVAADSAGAVQKGTTACAISLLQADALPQGLHRRQLPHPPHCLHLV